MKKLSLTLLLTSLLISCSDNNTNNEDIFIATNPLKGLWYQIDKNDSIVLSFDQSIEYYKIFNRKEKQYTGGHTEYYKLTDNQIIYYNNDKEYSRSLYSIKNDTLFIKNTTKVSTYTKIKESYY